MMIQIHRVLIPLLLTTLLIGCAAQDAAQEREEDKAKPTESNMSTRQEMPETETTPAATTGPALIAPAQTDPAKSKPENEKATAAKKQKSRSTARRAKAARAPKPQPPAPGSPAPEPSSDANRAFMAATAPLAPSKSAAPKATPKATPKMVPKMVPKMAPAQPPAMTEATATAPPTESEIPKDASTPPMTLLFRAETPTAPEGEEAGMGEDGDEEFGDDDAMEEGVAEDGEEEDYQVVKVFYGTDRKAIIGIIPNLLREIPWSLVSMISGAVTLLVCILCIFWIRGKKAIFLPILLLLLTIGTGIASTFFPYQSKPEFAKTDIAYSGQRGAFELGTCEISIPKTHQLAELEAPSVFKFEINEDPAKHVVLLGIDRMEEGPFLEDLREAIATSAGKEAFVFIHGYNVTFENAARRTAQLAYDLEFKGAPIFYSWPSQGSLLGYTVDESNVEWSVPNLKAFLKLIAKESGAKRVHLIAHSMGNRALSRALEKLSYSDTKDGPIFNEVILTAPDIDADVFRRDLAPRIVKTAQRVTLYASSNDEALIASKKVHGYPRAGESGDGVVVIDGIDTIDVSGLDTSLLGHSYYGSNDTVLIDMAQLLLESKPPTLRSRLQSMKLNGLRYWVFFVEKLEDLREGIKERTGRAP